MKSIIKNLTPEQKDALAALAEECSSYKEACAQARDQLGIQISPATLCRFYTTYKIADDAETRAEYAAAAGIDPADLMQLTQNQLQLRLLELASRPNPGASDLRALFQIITRMQALGLSERRVVVAERRMALAEKREALMDTTQQPPSPPTPTIVSQDEMTHYVKKLLGKEITLGDELISFSDQRPDVLSDSPSSAADNSPSPLVGEGWGERDQDQGPAISAPAAAPNTHPNPNPPELDHPLPSQSCQLTRRPPFVIRRADD